MKRKWTIQVSYDANNEQGKTFRARSVFQTEANDISEAYQIAEDAFKGKSNTKLGAIFPGHHMVVP